MVQFRAGLAVKVLTYQVDEFVCVLAGGGNSDSAGPVVVHVGEFVRQSLDGIRRQCFRFLDDHEVRGSHSALAHRLGNQEKVLKVEPGYGVIKNCPGWRVVIGTSSHSKEPGVDALLDNNEGEAWVIVSGHHVCKLFLQRGSV